MKLTQSIQTVSGKLISLTDTNPDDILITDIAWGLARIPRFVGQTQYRYTVAEHSVWVSRIIDPRFAMAGLLHDAAEYLIGDIPAPVKRLCPEIEELELDLLRAIGIKFGVSLERFEYVRDTDMSRLVREATTLFAEIHGEKWRELAEPDRQPVFALRPDASHEDLRRLFLSRYQEILEDKDARGYG